MAEASKGSGAITSFFGGGDTNKSGGKENKKKAVKDIEDLM